MTTPTVEDLDRLWLDAYHRHMDTNWQLGQGDYAEQLALARQAGIKAILDALTDAADVQSRRDPITVGEVTEAITVAAWLRRIKA